MSTQDREDLFTRLRAALRLPSSGGGDNALTSVLRGVHPADIVEAMERLTQSEALAAFNWLDNARAAEVLDELDPNLARFLTENAPPGRIADLLDRLPMDDAAEVVAEARPEQQEALLAALERRSPSDAAEVRELLSYGENTAGRLMTDKFVRLDAAMTVEQAFTAIRHADPDVETLSDLYVVEPGMGGERLVGVLSLRQLVRARPEQVVQSIMTPEIVMVTVDTDQEEVARLISKYDFLAMPVLDRSGALAGIVTVDDVVDILLQEQAEDVLKQSAIEPGVLTAPYFVIPVWRAVRSRVGWLLLLFVGGTITTTVLHSFDADLKKVTALSYFIPLLIGTGGNTGAQTVSTIIRGLAVQEIRPRDAARVLVRELRSGALLGLVLGLIAFVVTLFYKTSVNPVTLSLVVGLSVLAICIWSNIIGSMVPLVAQRFKIDPALVSAPLITTLVDATGLVIYLMIARALLTALHT